MKSDKFWQIVPDSNRYRSFEFADKRSTIEIKRSLHTGCSLLEHWGIPQLKFYDGEKKEIRKPVADLYSFCGDIILTDETKSKLFEFIHTSVEFLPTHTEIGLCWWLNMALVDCLDREKSELKYFSDGGIMEVIRYAFLVDRLNGIHLFCIPEVKGRVFLISDELKQYIEKIGIRGLSFMSIDMAE
jgi:hypothetical protein